MNELVRPWQALVTVEDSLLEQEFADRLRESSTLAFRVAYGVLRHREDAEDVAQEAFIRAHRSFDQLRDRERFRAWLVRTTWRLAIDRIRNEKRRVAREQAVEMAPDASVEQMAVARERSRALWQAIDELPEKLRIAIVLAAIEGHDIAEVARLLDVPPGTVKSRLFLARQQLTEKLCSPTTKTSNAS
jgi:RNA polymerase sigma-70 factor (ECF subfamily)